MTDRKKKEFRCRSALLARAVAAAEKFTRETGEPSNVYDVLGGYESRPASLGAPHGSHTLRPDGSITKDLLDRRARQEAQARQRQADIANRKPQGKEKGA